MAKGNHTGKGGFRDHPENRNRHGQRSSAVVAFSKSLRELIVAEGNATLTVDGKKKRKVELMIRQLWGKAISGEAWAVQFIAERVEGKVKDEIDHNIKGQLEVFNHDAITGLLAGRPSRDHSAPGSD